MLQHINIQNYALIDELKVNWGKHLNIITGETGSGKSILLGALGLILGDRAEANVLLDKTKKCIVEATFKIDKHIYYQFFEEHELDFDEDVFIRREINPQGKSRAFINDTPVNLQVLKSLASRLVDLHLQNETQELNGPSFHLEIVDTIAQNNSLLKEYQSSFNQLKQTEKKLNELKNLQQQAHLEKDYKTFLLNELLEAKLSVDELEQMEQEAEKLEHAEKITEQASQALRLLQDSEENILDQLLAVKNLLIQAGKHDAFFQTLSERLSSSIIELKDISAEAELGINQIVQDPKRLDQVNDRLRNIYQLMQKHRLNSVEELMALQEKLDEEVSQMQSLDQDIAATEELYTQLKLGVETQANQLSQKRKKAFDVVEKGINALLPEAGLEKSKIKIEHLSKPLSISGIDEIQFLFSANTGSQFLPLHKTASGGELARFMLCIKTYIAGKTNLPTLIFDEIDTGVSGQVAIKIGNLMKTLSSKHQLITVTHLPQIAGKADKHFKLYKKEIQGKTYSRIKELEQEEKVNELAEMLGGISYGDKTLQAALELLK